MIRNTNIRLEQGVNKIKNKFKRPDYDGLDMWLHMTEERIPKKILHTKWGESDQEEVPEPDG